LCPGQMKPAMPYVNGNYSAGLQVDQVPAPCCGKPHYTVSIKDYMVPVGEEGGMFAKRGVEKMRASGASDSAIAKVFPKTRVVGKSVVGGKKGKVSYKIQDKDSDRSFELRVKPKCCSGSYCNPCNNCNQGILKGNLCKQIRTPIWDDKDNKVAHVVQLVPLIPTGCCVADEGPTLQMSIHKEPDVDLSEDDIARLALLLFTVKPNVPGNLSGGPGGPSQLVGKALGNMALSKMGYVLNVGLSNVDNKYVSLREVMNGELAGIGDFLDLLRGKKKLSGTNI